MSAADIESITSDVEYETAFDKLQKMQSRLAHPGDENEEELGASLAAGSTKKKRSKAYGVSSLEALTNEEQGAALSLDIDTFANEDVGNRKSMFDLDNMSDGNLSDGNLSDADKSGNLSDGDVSVASEKRPAGRSKGRKKSVMQLDDGSGASKADAAGKESDDEEMEFDQTEASGYGFSQGIVRADAAEEASLGENEAESDTGAPEAMDVELKAKDAGETPEEEEQTETQEPSSPPTEAALYAVVDSIFEAADKNTMTVKQVNKSVAAHFNIDKVDKEMKGLIKDRLTKLVSGEIKVGAAKEKKSKKSKKAKQEKEAEPEDEFQGDVESEEEVNYDSSSDYDEAPAKKAKRKSRKQRQSDDASLSDESFASDKARKSRRRRSSSGKMAKHLRDHANKLRKRQLEESRIRQEEMGNIAAKAEEGPKLSEEDRARAQAIAARFDTNREEELVKREEDRVGLIDVLRRKRLEIITLEDGDKVQDGVESKEAVKSEVMIDLEDDEEDSSDEDDELELVAPTATAPIKKPSAMDCLMAKPGDLPAPIVRNNKPKQAANSRLALRNALRAKQVKAGNRWLAR